MQISIPEEIQPYVWVDPKNGLVHEDDMPDELIPLFNEAKLEVEAAKEQRKKELLDLLGE